MGYLSARDMGNIEVSVVGGLYEGNNPSPDGTQNIDTNDGILNLKSYSLSLTTGKVSNTDANIAGNVTRVSSGSKLPIPIELKAYFTRKRASEGALLTPDEMRNLSYLLAWSRSNTIIMLFYTPFDATTLDRGQDKDFYTSSLKMIYDVIWDTNLGTTPYTSTTYGSIRYDTGKQFNSTDYHACAIPIIITDVVTNETADKSYIDVSVKGYVLENEGH